MNDSLKLLLFALLIVLAIAAFAALWTFVFHTRNWYAIAALSIATNAGLYWFWYGRAHKDEDPPRA